MATTPLPAVLPGTGTTDYARYMRTDDLLALQRGPREWVHPDELLFQVVHQSSELCSSSRSRTCPGPRPPGGWISPARPNSCCAALRSACS